MAYYIESDYISFLNKFSNAENKEHGRRSADSFVATSEHNDWERMKNHNTEDSYRAFLSEKEPVYKQFVRTKDRIFIKKDHEKIKTLKNKGQQKMDL